MSFKFKKEWNLVKWKHNILSSGKYNLIFNREQPCPSANKMF